MPTSVPERDAPPSTISGPPLMTNTPAASLTPAPWVIVNPPQYVPGWRVTLMPSMIFAVDLQEPVGGVGRAAKGSGSTGQSVVGCGEKLALVAFTLPPAEQIMPARNTALSCDFMPSLLVEFDCTRQPGAVINAFACRPMVSGADGSRPSRHSGNEPLRVAVALTLNGTVPAGRTTPVMGVYFLSM